MKRNLLAEEDSLLTFKKFVMKHSVRFSAILFLLFLFSYCDDGYNSPNPNPGPSTTTFVADLSGIREVPENDSDAMGTATLVFNNTTKIFTISVTHNVVEPTEGHIHKGMIGEIGAAVFPFPSVVSPISYTSSALTVAQEADLRAELYYVNIHSDLFPNGEIRGQLFKQGTGGGSY